MRARRGIFAALYFSGAWSALVLEVGWTRLMAVLLGSSQLAVSSVLAAFMGGLAAGAYLGGRLAGRLRRPLAAFALILFLGAAMAHLPALVRLAAPGVDFAAALLGVAFACLPLGAAFPVACHVRATGGGRQAAAPARLYALDTAGALAGLIAAVGLIPYLGISGCLSTAAITRSLAGLVCLLLMAGAGQAERQANPADPAPADRLVPRAAVWLAIVCGFCGLGAETVWNRLLAFVLYKGSTTYAFAAMLAAVIGPASLGAWTAARLGHRHGGTRERALRLAAAGAVLDGFCLLLSVAWLLVAGPQPSGAAIGLADLATTLFACGPASFCSGMVFAAVVQTARAGQVARPAGMLLAVNSIAATAGALIVPLVLVPAAGLSASLLALGLLVLLVGWVTLGQAGRRWPGVVPLAAIAAAAGLLLAGPRWVRHLGDPVYYREGRDVSVAAVDEPGGRRLFVDGIAVAGTDLIMASDQKTLAHLPLLLHPGPHSALTVGFGSGGTSYSMLLHPGLRVSCVEISPTVVSAAGYFKAANHGLLEGKRPARYRLIVADARRWLTESPERYDVIVNDCTDLAYRSDASLYTRDFFILLRRHLNPDGLAAAWIPLRGQAPWRVLRSLIATFGSVFPKMSLWVIDAYPTHFGILAGSSRPQAADLARFHRILQKRAVRADLDEIGLGDAARLASLRQFGDAELRRFARGAELHTDDRPLIEFMAPAESGGDASAYDALLAVGRSRSAIALSHFTRDDLAKVGRLVLERPWLLAGHRAYLAGRPDQARIFYLRAMLLDPADPAPRALVGLDNRPSGLAGRAAASLLEGRPGRAVDTLGPPPRSGPDDARDELVRGEALLRLGRRLPAIDAFRRVIAVAPRGKLAGGAFKGLARASLPAALEWLVWVLTFDGL